MMDDDGITALWELVITSAPMPASLATSASYFAGSTMVIQGHSELWWKKAKPSAHIAGGISSTRSTGSAGIGAQNASAA